MTESSTRNEMPLDIPFGPVPYIRDVKGDWVKFSDLECFGVREGKIFGIIDDITICLGEYADDDTAQKALDRSMKLVNEHLEKKALSI